MALLDAYMDSATEKGIPGIYIYPVSSLLSYQLPHDFASLDNVPPRTELLMPHQQALRRKHRLNSRPVLSLSWLTLSFNLPLCMVCVYYCSTYYKAVRVCGGGNNGGHVLQETTS